MSYQFIQITNPTVGAVATGALLPLGSPTRSRMCGCNSSQPTFAVSTTGSNTITLTDEGYYKLTYTGNLVAGAAGTLILNLLQNGIPAFSASATATAAGTENIAFSFIVRVQGTGCCQNRSVTPITLQIANAATSVALTGGTSNLIVEKIASC